MELKLLTLTLKKKINNNVWNIAEDKHGTIWFGCEKEIWTYANNNLTLVFDSIRITPTFLKDSKGNFWISGLHDGIAVCVEEKYNTNILDELDDVYIEEMFEDKNNNIWFCTSTGLYLFSKDTLTLFTKNNGLPDDYIQTINQDDKGNIWIGTNSGGVSVYNGVNFLNISQYQGIGFNNIAKIFLDKNNNIWIGTDGAGASIFNGFAFQHYVFPKHLTNNLIWSILIDSDDTKWFGTDGNGLIKYKNNNLKIYTTKDGLADNHANCLLEDSKGNIWIGTNSGLSKYNGKYFKNYTTKNGLPDNQINCLLEDNKGNIWISIMATGIAKFDGKSFTNYSIKDGLVDNYIWDIFQDKKGLLYFGTDEGLSIYDGKTFKTYTTENGLKENSIWSIDQDHYGNIWMGTNDGITWYNGKIFKNYTSYNILNSNVIYIIIFDINNNLIVGTEKGINKITYNENGDILAIRHYGKAEGFYGVECNANAVSTDSYGVLWFGTIKGVSTYNPNEDFIKYDPPITNITNIKLFYKDIDWHLYTDTLSKWNFLPKNLILPYNKNNLTFEFVGINYNIPEKVKYQFKLEGTDLNWLPITTKNQATYTNLSSGKYIFKVQSCNSNGIWNPAPASYNFEIKSPYWQKTWFYIVIILFVSFIIYIIIFLRVKRLQNMRKLLTKKVKERTWELYMQKEELQTTLELNQQQKEKLKGALKINREQREELVTTLSLNENQKKELEKANVEIQKASKLKELFLANTSHEIRTPLNVIYGYTNLLLNTDLSEKQFSYLKNIKTSSNNLIVVINDILDFSKIEAGKLSIEKIELDLPNLIRDLYYSISVKANEKKINLKYSIQKDVPRFIKGDPVRLSQILINLIRNAIKFTPEEGNIKILIETSEITDNHVTITFKIVDSGIGITKDKLSSIFESFTQASSDTTRRFGGTGLGLSIVKKLVDIQGGTINVQSEINKGSTFSFTLSYEIASGKKLLEKEDSYFIRKAEVQKNLKILLVEDNPVNVTLAIDTILLYNNKINIDVAVNGKIAVDKILKNTYDLIIMDIQMPEMDGYEATKHIRNNLSPPNNQTPILGMSAHAMKEEKDKCYEMGMNDYLTKPFVPEELFSKIEKLTKQKIKKVDKEIKEIKLNKEFFKNKYIDLSLLNKTYKGDFKKLKKILTLYLENVPEQIKGLNQYYYKRNWKELQVISHSLKTSLNYLGLNDLKELSKNIELSAASESDFDTMPDMIKMIEIGWEEAKVEINDIIEN